MEVTLRNFEELLPRIESAISSCQFLAIDGEFSGLSLTHPRVQGLRAWDVLQCAMSSEILQKRGGVDDAEQWYTRARISAQNFLIMQFGLSTFHWNAEENFYQAQTFNFYTFPRSYGAADVRFTCQASSLDFLREHGFDFNKFIRFGIPYVSLEQLKLDKRLEAREPRDPIVLRKEEDRSFVDQQLDIVRAWVDRTVAKQANGGAEADTLVLEPSNSYLRAALYQRLEQQFGKSDFFVDHLRTAGSRKSSLKLTRATSDAVAAQESEVAAKRQRQQERAKGFASVMQCLTTCKKPVVGHNMLLDLTYLYQQFIGNLPASVDEFREQLKLIFPGGVYDTKYLAQFFPRLFPSTSLEELHTSLAPKEDGVKEEDSEDGEKFNELPASVPGAVNISNNQQSSSADPESVVHNLNGTGSMEPSSLQIREGTRNAHVILADLSPYIDGQSTSLELPKVDHAEQFDRYRTTADEPSRYHEAGFDAYQTGKIFVWLSKLFEARRNSDTLGNTPLDIQAVQEFGNRIFVMRSDIPYLPLEGPIPTPDRSSMFLLSSTNRVSLPSQDDILLRFSALGCPIDRVLWLNAMTCYVTLVDRSQEVEVSQAIRAADWPFMFGPFRSPSFGFSNEFPSFSHVPCCTKFRNPTSCCA